MKTRLGLLFLMFILAIFGHAQIPNSSFENWSNPNGYNTPDDWGNLNAKTAGASIYTCLKGTPGNPGSAYLKLISRAVTGMGVQPGIAVSGTLNTTTFNAVSGFAYADRPTSLKGNWQFMANGSDQGYIAIFLTKWNDVLNIRDTIGKKKYLLPGMVMSWQAFTIPITYLSSDIPDSAIIILSASGTVPVNGSYLYIDNLTFYGSTVGLNDPSLSSGLLIYPNPVAGNKIQIAVENSGIVAESMDILDLQGKLVENRMLRNLTLPFSLDISILTPGVYILRINSITGTYSRKFIKQ